MTSSSETLRETLADAGYRLTSPRRVVWGVLAGAGGHLTADEIAEAARVADPTINLSSVYRSLGLFAELGMVRESNLGSSGASHWEMAHPDEQFHLRCISCGAVEHHSGDLVNQVRDHLAEDHGFEAARVELLVSGLCRTCAASKQGPQAS